MQIEGSKTEDNSEIIITVRCEMEGEFEIFNHYFQKMLQSMAEDSNAIFIDPETQEVYGSANVTEEEATEAMKQFAIQSATEANRNVSQSLRNNFI